MATFYVRRPHEGKSLVKEACLNLLQIPMWMFERVGISFSMTPKKW